MSACRTCGEQNPERARFCLNCGAPQAVAPATDPTTERKVVTVLFCDLVGFTARSELADPEDVHARLAPYHRLLRAVIETFGGTVEKFIGDAVMAVFGAPLAHEDDPERAVRAGLRILESIEELNRAEPGADLSVRIGVNTGDVVVTLGARPELGEAMVAGDAVNTAARLQTAAPVGGVVVGEQTFRSTERVFDYQALEPVQVKGKSGPLALWRANAARARFGTDLTRASGTPYVGRAVERALLMTIFDRSVRDDAVHLVTVVGEPGLGKSRLVAELFVHADGQPGLTRWRQGRCLPYGDGISFWPLTEILKAESGILESDSADVARQKLGAAVPEHLADRAWVLERLGPLVGLEGFAGTDREEQFSAWRRFLEAKSQERPSVFVFEDLHWADAAMLAFVEYLAEYAEGVPMLLVGTARPELYERHPGWAGGHRNTTAINLAPLSPEETTQLMSGLLERVSLPEAVQRTVLERAGGNPLYAEEFARLLRDRGLLVDDGSGGIIFADGADVPLPDGIAALIAARLDTLAPERKRVLQDASVMGKVFWAGAVAAMGSRDRQDVLAALHELSRKELVRPARASSMAGEAEYGFWHVLVRDVAYGQIPRASRADKHRRAAAWIESVASERLDDVAEVLAYHLSTALELARAAGRAKEVLEMTPEARRFLTLAGDRQMSLDAARAMTSYRHALDLVTADDPERAMLLVKLGEAARWQGKADAAAALYAEAVAAFNERGAIEPADEANLLLANALNNLDRGDEGRAVVDGVIARWQDRPPGTVLARALAARSTYAGVAEEQIGYAQRAIVLADLLDLPEVRARGLMGRGRVLATSTGDASGVDDLRRAVEIWRDIGQPQQIANAYSMLADALTNQSPAEGLLVLDEGLAYITGKGLALAELSLMSSRTFALAELSHLDEMLRHANEQVSMANARGATFYESNAELFLIFEQTFRGDVERAAERAEVLVCAAADWAPYVCVFRVRGRIAQGRGAEAAALLEETIEVAASRNEDFGDYASMSAREAIRIGRPDLVVRCLAMAVGDLALARNARSTIEAMVAESKGQHAHALVQYGLAATGWLEFGNLMEQAYALLGEARCRFHLGLAEEARSSWAAGTAALAALGIPGGREDDGPIEHAAALYGRAGPA